MGMQGDVYDLCAILEWAGKFWSSEEKFIWNLEFRLAICEASKELCTKFERAEMSHRRHHMLSAIDWNDTSELQDVRFLGRWNPSRIVDSWLTIKP
jgi:hypothetical protein